MISTNKSSRALSNHRLQRLAAAPQVSPSQTQYRDLSVVTQFFPPDYAATGQLLEELMMHLAQQGFNIRVFTGQPGYAFDKDQAPSQEIRGRLRIQRTCVTQLFSRRIRGKAINGLLFFIRALLHIVRHNHRKQLLLLTTAPPFLPFLGYIANRLFGIPYACILYDLYPDIAVELDVISYQHWVAKLWRWANRLVWARASELIVLSPAMRGRIISHMPEIATKVTVIHSWADAEAIQPIAKNANWFAKTHHLVKPFTVLYSGNMGRCHDMATILEAACLLRHEPIQFVFIGGGAKRQQLIQEAENRKLSNFLFLPYQEKAHLPYSLTACDLSLVSVSADMDTLVAPSKLYPALASGRPVGVICPPQAYLRSMIHEAQCGATFANGESVQLAEFIRTLAADPALAQQLGQASRRYLKANFTIDVIAKAYAQVLEPFLKLPCTTEAAYSKATTLVSR
jgi:glycosyltransferase involved in cell wall biosynthesis